MRSPRVTQKLIDVALIDIVEWLRGKVAEKFAYTETDAFFNGNGVARPRGFLTYTTAATADVSRAWGELEPCEVRRQ
jgi:HK97 family phage major capsid protein